MDVRITVHNKINGHKISQESQEWNEADDIEKLHDISRVVHYALRKDYNKHVDLRITVNPLVHKHNAS